MNDGACRFCAFVQAGEVQFQAARMIATAVGVSAS